MSITNATHKTHLATSPTLKNTFSSYHECIHHIGLSSDYWAI